MFKLQIHPLIFLILNIIFVLTIIFTHNTILNLSIILLTIINTSIHTSNNIKFKYLYTILITLSLIFSSYYITAYIFSAKLSFYKIIELSTRVIAITFTSILFTLQINFEDLVHYLMRKYKLSVKLGYALISAINSINNLYNEFNQIKIAYSMRYNKPINYFRIISSLFISAARFAYHNGISLSSRGLNINKTYIRNLIKINPNNYIILIINFIILGVLINFTIK